MAQIERSKQLANGLVLEDDGYRLSVRRPDGSCEVFAEYKHSDIDGETQELVLNTLFGEQCKANP